MCHHNPTSTSCVLFRRNTKVTKPYYHQYIDSYRNSNFKHASSKNRYVQILQYVADHAFCKRFEIQKAVWKFPVKGLIAKDLRGFASTIFSQLLYLDLIDYNKKYEYVITPKGEAVLKTAYLNDMAKLVNKK